MDMAFESEIQRYKVHFDDPLILASALRKELDKSLRQKGMGPLSFRLTRVPAGAAISIDDIEAGKRPNRKNCGVDVILRFPSKGLLDCTVKYCDFRKKVSGTEALRVAGVAGGIASSALGVVAGNPELVVGSWKLVEEAARVGSGMKETEKRQAALYAEVKQALARSLKACDFQCVKVAPSQEAPARLAGSAPYMGSASQQGAHQQNASNVSQRIPANGFVSNAGAAPMVSYCSNCGARLRRGAAFCPECGKPVNAKKPQARTCPRCGALLKDTAQFCPNCGTRVS